MNHLVSAATCQPFFLFIQLGHNTFVNPFVAVDVFLILHNLSHQLWDLTASYSTPPYILQVFLDKAIELAQRLLPAFNTTTGIPMSLINLQTSTCRMFVWSRDKCSILAEAGTLHMEFKYLSELSGDPIYAAKVDRIRHVISSLKRSKGMFYNYLDYRKPRWCANVSGLGGLADSFYEYLLKEWIRTDHRDIQAHELYQLGIEALFENGVFRESEKGHLYLSTFSSGLLSDTMEHLACFAGGMLALGARDKSDIWFHRAVEITRTCTYSYDVSITNLGPESFTFSPGIEAIPVKQNQKSYLQRPETVESYFYLWRLTKNETYRTVALKVVEATQAELCELITLVLHPPPYLPRSHFHKSAISHFTVHVGMLLLDYSIYTVSCSSLNAVANSG
ncbi:unnamed protein product [Dicrocoelium dendriticum]|nr:unnamed protein product [Dicrocoelium dendriticum]